MPTKNSNKQILQFEKELLKIEKEIELNQNNTKHELKTFEKSIEILEEKIDNDLKKEIWELKQNIKNIQQNEKNIAVLDEQFNTLGIKILGFKNEIEAKMVTHKDLNEKKYKDWRLWISIFAICISLFTLYSNSNTSIKELFNVSSSHKK